MMRPGAFRTEWALSPNMLKRERRIRAGAPFLCFVEEKKSLRKHNTDDCLAHTRYRAQIII